MDKTTKKNKQIDDTPHRILQVKTSHTGIIKQVFERMSTVISDCCIVFIPPDKNLDQNQDDDYYEEVEETVNDSKKNKKFKKSKDVEPVKKTKKTGSGGGIRILRLTEDRSILIKLNLESDKFDEFICEEPKITIGVDINYLHSMLKLINDDDPIIFYINSNDRGILYISSMTRNNDNSEETDLELNLMDIRNPDLPISQTGFQNKITIASEKFHNICKHFNNNTTYVEIISFNDEISFRGKNEGGKLKKTYKDIHSDKKKTGPPVIVQGVYELKNLLSFSKCGKLCPTIDIYLKNDFPLVLSISVATLGKMYIFLSPVENGIK